jgi:16S rRNA (guanine527-N7)-methyltransferase
MKSQAIPTDTQEILALGADLLGIELSPEALARLVRHLDLVREWNRKINLTAITDPKEMAILHTLDSLTVMKILPDSVTSIVDIGTGAGFPGLVLRIARDRPSIDLMDKNPKKIVFLKHAANQLDLKRLGFLNLTLKDLLNSGRIYDLAISRAFSSNPDILNSLFSLVRTGGYLVQMAGPASGAGLPELERFVHVNRWEGQLPFSENFRRVILYQKF